jgi:hypothetical protein
MKVIKEHCPSITGSGAVDLEQVLRNEDRFYD